MAVSLCLPAAALAQGAFGPLPPNAPPPPVQTQPPRSNTVDDGSISPQTTWLLIGIMVVGLGAVVWYIRRDARAAAPVDERRRTSADDIHGHKSSAARHKQERKRQARAKGKRQRQARKKHR